MARQEGDWSDWQSLGAARRSEILAWELPALARNNDGRLELYMGGMFSSPTRRKSRA